MENCRICGEMKLSDEVSFSIWNKRRDQTIKELVEIHCDVVLDSRDFLPQRCCRPCFKKIDSFAAFSRQVRFNQENLKLQVCRIVENDDSESDEPEVKIWNKNKPSVECSTKISDGEFPVGEVSSGRRGSPQMLTDFLETIIEDEDQAPKIVMPSPPKTVKVSRKVFVFNGRWDEKGPENQTKRDSSLFKAQNGNSIWKNNEHLVRVWIDEYQKFHQQRSDVRARIPVKKAKTITACFKPPSRSEADQTASQYEAKILEKNTNKTPQECLGYCQANCWCNKTERQEGAAETNVAVLLESEIKPPSPVSKTREDTSLVTLTEPFKNGILKQTLEEIDSIYNKTDPLVCDMIAINRNELMPNGEVPLRWLAQFVDFKTWRDFHFACNCCHKVFDGLVEYASHGCKFSSRNVNESEVLSECINEMTSVLAPLKFCCVICSKMFFNMRFLSSHYQQKHPSQGFVIFPCLECGHYSKSLSQLLKHKNTQHEPLTLISTEL